MVIVSSLGYTYRKTVDIHFDRDIPRKIDIYLIHIINGHGNIYIIYIQLVHWIDKQTDGQIVRYQGDTNWNKTIQITDMW